MRILSGWKGSVTFRVELIIFSIVWDPDNSIVVQLISVELVLSQIQGGTDRQTEQTLYLLLFTYVHACALSNFIWKILNGLESPLEVGEAIMIKFLKGIVRYILSIIVFIVFDILVHLYASLRGPLRNTVVFRVTLKLIQTPLPVILIEVTQGFPLFCAKQIVGWYSNKGLWHYRTDLSHQKNDHRGTESLIHDRFRLKASSSAHKM